jgi:hypothetical protein
MDQAENLRKLVASTRQPKTAWRDRATSFFGFCSDEQYRKVLDRVVSLRLKSEIEMSVVSDQPMHYRERTSIPHFHCVAKKVLSDMEGIVDLSSDVLLDLGVINLEENLKDLGPGERAVLILTPDDSCIEELSKMTWRCRESLRRVKEVYILWTSIERPLIQMKSKLLVNEVFNSWLDIPVTELGHLERKEYFLEEGRVSDFLIHWNTSFESIFCSHEMSSHG